MLARLVLEPPHPGAARGLHLGQLQFWPSAHKLGILSSRIARNHGMGSHCAIDCETERVMAFNTLVAFSPPHRFSRPA
jgi:hypothetical protein